MAKVIARTFFIEEASRYADDLDDPGRMAGNFAGVTMFSTQMLTNSDYFAGTFPAECGNAVAGVSDRKLRNGNSHQ